MYTGTLLDTVVYAFRDLFDSRNFALFSAYIWGTILCEGRHTISGIWLAGQPQSRYWSLVKFLSRGKWDDTQVVQRLIGLILEYVTDWVYIYDHTHTIKTGKKQVGLHFFHNHRYRKRNTNQSKLHWGHQFAGLGVVGMDGLIARLFPVWVAMLDPEALGVSALVAFESIVSVIPAGLIVFDRGFNNRKYFKCLLQHGHHLLCRARKNAAFYYLPTEAEQPKKGRKKIYGKRVHIQDLYAHRGRRVRRSAVGGRPDGAHPYVSPTGAPGRRAHPTQEKQTVSLLSGLHHRSEFIREDDPPVLQVEVGI